MNLDKQEFLNFAAALFVQSNSSEIMLKEYSTKGAKHQAFERLAKRAYDLAEVLWEEKERRISSQDYEN